MVINIFIWKQNNPGVFNEKYQEFERKKEVQTNEV